MPRPSRKASLRRLITSIAFCALLFGLLGYASAVLKPGRTPNREQGGAAWASYLTLPENSVDVVFLGNSHVFVGVDPCAIWSTRGIPAFVQGGPMQPLPVTVYYLREALRTQKPRVVAVEMSSVAYDASKFNREFNQINIGYMPWSINKVEAALRTTPATEQVGVLVDLWTYHGRWSELTDRDYDIASKNRGGTYLRGFLPKLGSEPVTATASAPPTNTVHPDGTLAYNMPALRKIASICRDADIELLLFLTPTGPPGSYSYQLNRVGETLRAEFDNVSILDLSTAGSVPTLSFETDFVDGGHLSYIGAAKTSAALADFLATSYGLENRRGDPAYASWDRAVTERDALIAKKLLGQKKK